MDNNKGLTRRFHHTEGCMGPLWAVRSIFRLLALMSFRIRAFRESWMFMMGDDFTLGIMASWRAAHTLLIRSLTTLAFPSASFPCVQLHNLSHLQQGMASSLVYNYTGPNT